MAPLPPESTARLFVDYETCGVQHTSMIRFAEGNTYVDAQVEWNDVVEAVDFELFQLTILGCRVANLGSTVTYPVEWVQQATYGAGPGPRPAGAWMLNFIGRSNGGRRVAFELFGCQEENLNEKYRITSAENANVAAALVELTSSEGTAIAIDGEQPHWQSYVNIGTNAYWRNKIR